MVSVVERALCARSTISHTWHETDRQNAPPTLYACVPNRKTTLSKISETVLEKMNENPRMMPEKDTQMDPTLASHTSR